MSITLSLQGKYTISIFSILFFTMNLTAQKEIVSKKVETVVIDAGHGGKDPGAIGKAAREKDITLAIATKTGEMIKSQNPTVKVIYTRNTDDFVELYQRANIANKAHADLFISIHANSNNKKDVHGTEFWVLGLHKADENLEVAKKENAVVNLENNVQGNYGFDPNSVEGNILMTMKQGLYLDKSIQFAKSLEKNYSFESNQINRGTKQAGFVVLYKTSMPSILVEVGFISNPEEEAFISSSEGQNEIAMKIASAFADYKMKFEMSSSTTTSPKNATDKTPSKVVTTTTSTTTGKIKQVEDDEEESLHWNDKSNNPTGTFSTTMTPVRKKIDIAAKEPAKSVDNHIKEATPTPPTKIKSNTEDYKASLAELTSSSTDTKAVKTSTEDNLYKHSQLVEQPAKKTNPTPAKPTPAKPNPIETKTATSTPAIKSSASPSTAVSTPKASTTPPSYIHNEEIRNQIIENAMREIHTPSKESASGQKTSSDELYRPISSHNSTDISYKIQIKASHTALTPDNPIVKAFSDVEQSHEDGYYKYLLGDYSRVEDARRRLEEIKSLGVKDAFIIRYQNGMRLK